jgi:hypothetical protein
MTNEPAGPGERRDKAMKHALVVLSFVVGLGPRAVAGEADRDAILDQLQAKFSACTAFYMFEQTCGARGETGRRLNAARRSAEALSGAIAMSSEQAALRLEIALAADRILAGGCDGLETLESRYAVQCEPLSSGPE